MADLPAVADVAASAGDISIVIPDEDSWKCGPCVHGAIWCIHPISNGVLLPIGLVTDRTVGVVSWVIPSMPA